MANRCEEIKLSECDIFVKPCSKNINGCDVQNNLCTTCDFTTITEDKSVCAPVTCPLAKPTNSKMNNVDQRVDKLKYTVKQMKYDLKCLRAETVDKAQLQSVINKLYEIELECKKGYNPNETCNCGECVDYECMVPELIRVYVDNQIKKSEARCKMYTDTKVRCEVVKVLDIVDNHVENLEGQIDTLRNTIYRSKRC